MALLHSSGRHVVWKLRKGHVLEFALWISRDRKFLFLSICVLAVRSTRVLRIHDECISIRVATSILFILRENETQNRDEKDVQKKIFLTKLKGHPNLFVTGEFPYSRYRNKEENTEGTENLFL